MPCACSKQTVTGEYILQRPDGTMQVFDSQVQAKAQWIREGKAGLVVPK